MENHIDLSKFSSNSQKMTFYHQPLGDVPPTEVLAENTQKIEQKEGSSITNRWFGSYTISCNLGKGVHELKSSSGKAFKEETQHCLTKGQLLGWLITDYLIASYYPKFYYVHHSSIFFLLLLHLYALLDLAMRKRHNRGGESS